MTVSDMIHHEDELDGEWDEYFDERDAQPVDIVGVRGAYVLIEGAEGDP